MNNVTRVLLTVLIFAVAVGITVAIVYLSTRPWKKEKPELDFVDLPSSKHPKGVEILTFDGKTAKVNDTSMYTVDKHSEGQPAIYLYTMNPETKCTGLKYDGAPVWTYDNGDYPKSIRVNMKEKNVFISFPHSFMYCNTENGSWVTQFDVPLNDLVELQSQAYTSSQYADFSLQGKIGTFIAKPGYAFNSVKFGSSQLWQTSDYWGVSNKVLVNPLPNGEIVVTVVTLDGNLNNFISKSR